MKGRIGISGYYGMNNYGDDLFAEVGTLAAGVYWPRFASRLVGARRYGAASILGLPVSAYRGTGTVGKACRLYAQMIDSLAVDRLVFAGGSLFHSSSSGLLRLLCRSATARRIGLSAIGVSVGPFASRADELQVRQQLGAFEYLSLRDELSYEIAGSFGLSAVLNRGADLALLYPDVRRARPPEPPGGRRIGFSPCHLQDDPMLAKRYCDRFIEWATQLPREVDIVIIGLNEHPTLGDAPLCRYTMEQLARRGLQASCTSYGAIGIDGAWDLIGSLDAYVTVRLHGAVTAFATGTPFALFEYHRKCTDFLDEIGFPSEARIEEDVASIEALIRARAAISGRRAAAMDLSASNFTNAPWAQGRS